MTLQVQASLLPLLTSTGQLLGGEEGKAHEAAACQELKVGSKTVTFTSFHGGLHSSTATRKH